MTARIFQVICITIQLICCPTLTGSFLLNYHGSSSSSSSLMMTASSLLTLVEHSNNNLQDDDTRPHEQRAKGPRLARRMNNGFRYLYRNNQRDSKLDTMTSFEYLSQFYPKEKILQMNSSFPPLLELNVTRHLHPKMRFLQETMGVPKDRISDIDIPPQYFGARLERTIAPRHAFLMYKNLPHGRQLAIDDPQKLQDFLLACRTTKRFCALCNQWMRNNKNNNDDGKSPMEQQQQQQQEQQKIITSKEIEAFDTMFGRGALAAARDELCQSNNTWPLDYINVTSSEILQLLIQHGSNPLERDNRGVSLLHWAAGTGNVQAVQILLDYFPQNGVLERTERDGATPLHWAVAGANSKEFGVGGHIDVCSFLLSKTDDPKKLVNYLTYDGNSPLMWASWSGTLDTVKLMIRNRADHTLSNRNGCKFFFFFLPLSFSLFFFYKTKQKHLMHELLADSSIRDLFFFLKVLVPTGLLVVEI